MANTGTISVAVTKAEQPVTHFPPDPGITRYAIGWTADGSGNVTQPLVTSTGAVLAIEGVVVQAEQVNDAVAVPTSGFNEALNDKASKDILCGQFQNFTGSTVNPISPGVKITDGTTIAVGYRVISEQPTLVITGAGAGGKGTLIVYVKM